MDRKQIIEDLTPIVREAFTDGSLVLSDDMSAETVESWTSLGFMRLLTSIEESFGFRFRMMDILNLKTMGDIIAAIERSI